jgi:hypothetical protein
MYTEGLCLSEGYKMLPLTGKYPNVPEAPRNHIQTQRIKGIVKGDSPNFPTNKLPIPATKIVESIDMKTIGPIT